MLNKPNLSGLPRIKQAFFNSLKGLSAVWKSEEAFRQEVIMILPLMLLTFWLDVTRVEQIILIASLVGVLIAELVNTAFEYVVDRISTEFNPISGSIKDIGSSLVLIAVLFAILVWSVILLN
jgi:diacylglycerol kinase (ATP)